MSNIKGIHHASVLVTDLARARLFYEQILGLTVNPLRPGKSFDGLWYDVGHEQIHLIVAESHDLHEETERYPGARRHVALRVEALEGIQAQLEAHGLPMFPSRSGRPVLFCRDFDDNAYELIAE
jgi:catechol 2,3-dioxygenase-like lactoylglutathione lyase family enzyme